MSYQITHAYGDALTICIKCLPVSEGRHTRFIDHGPVRWRCYFCQQPAQPAQYWLVRPHDLPERLLGQYERASVIVQGEAELSNAPPLDYGMFDVAETKRLFQESTNRTSFKELSYVNAPYTFGTSGKK